MPSTTSPFWFQQGMHRTRPHVTLAVGVSAVVLIIAGSLSLTTCPVVAGEPLRLVTFNAQCLAAPGTRATRIPRYRWDSARKNHLERVANLIETLQPDILNLLEVTSNEAVEHLVQILHDKGLTEYRGFHVESGDKFTGFDVALVTRLAPDAVEGQSIRCILSPPGDLTWRANYSFVDEAGKLQEKETAVARHAIYYFQVRGIRIGLLGLHLKANPNDRYSNSRRTAESLICQRIIQKEIVDRGYLPIVLGDLNDYDPDVPDLDDTRNTQTTVLANLKNYDASSKETELFNPALLIERLADRATSHWDRNENDMADSEDVFTMIDYVLLPKAFRSAVQRMFVCRVSDLKTSDHWPVVVDMDLSRILKN
jgi:endonuclease/exonuclease/phosphatase family metal-dependent hydrolase